MLGGVNGGGLFDVDGLGEEAEDGVVAADAVAAHTTPDLVYGVGEEGVEGVAGEAGRGEVGAG